MIKSSKKNIDDYNNDPSKTLTRWLSKLNKTPQIKYNKNHRRGIKDHEPFSHINSKAYDDFENMFPMGQDGKRHKKNRKDGYDSKFTFSETMSSHVYMDEQIQYNEKENNVKVTSGFRNDKAVELMEKLGVRLLIQDIK